MNAFESSVWRGNHTVLCIGVGSFETGVSEWEDLPFASDKSGAEEDSCADIVAAGFQRFGLATRVLHDVRREDIGGELRQALANCDSDADLVIVHLVGHGLKDPSGHLRFIDRSGNGFDIDSVMVDAHRPDGPKVVFLLDVCGAGTAAGSFWSAQIGDDRRVWAIGACTSDAITERGKFSRAVADALHALADTDFPTVTEQIDFAQFFRELARCAQLRACERLSLNFQTDLGDGDWPFLPNPYAAFHSSNHSALAMAALQFMPSLNVGAVIAALEAGADIEDAAHFAERASGRALASSDLRRGLFTGQREALDHLERWRSSRSRLLVVSGGPGSGKSALLGLLVCAGHPELREPLRPLWKHVVGAPAAPIPGLIAAHARQRSAGEVMDTIATQAALGSGPYQGELGASRMGWTAASIREALAQTSTVYVIVIDAVDESTEVSGVNDLIRTLCADGEQSRLACRLVIGSRSRAIGALTNRGGSWDHLDLDSMNREFVETDVRDYIDQLLNLNPAYSEPEKKAIRAELARSAAARLVQPEGGQIQWGPFLVAAVFANYLTSLPHPPPDLLYAKALAAQAVPDLPAMLELDFAARFERYPLIRPVLSALARAQGDGMPRSVLQRAASAFLPERLAFCRELSEESLRETLALAHPYLWIGVDPSSGQKLYRLFHRGLADHLRKHPLTPDEIPNEEQQRRLDELMLTRMLRRPDPLAYGEPGGGFRG